MSTNTTSGPSTPAILPGAGETTLGVVGGGQLGRMFVHAAQSMGYFTAVLDPDPASPAGRVSHHHVHADYMDADGLARLGNLCSAITTEFENVPAAALTLLAAFCPVAPAAAAVAIAQDRAAEKAHFVGCGVPCAPYAVIDTAEQLAAAVREHWGVENRLHWVLDVGVSEDTKDNAPQNLSMLRNIALTIIRTDKTDTRKSSLRLKRTGAAWDDGVRERLLGEGLLGGVADFGCHLDHDTEQFLAALRHGDRQIDAAADLHRPDTQTTAGRRVGHQTVRQKGMQGDDGFRIDADVFGIAHQIFDGRLVVEDHLGFQSILAPNSAPFRTDAQRVADAAERFASCCALKPQRLVRCTRLFRIGAVS